jgi:hypothetical protein
MVRTSDEVQRERVEADQRNANPLVHSIQDSSTTKHPILADVKVGPGGYEDEHEEGKLL